MDGRVRRPGVFVHPKHNWFMSTALSESDVDSVLVATDAAFGEAAKRYAGPDDIAGIDLSAAGFALAQRITNVAYTPELFEHSDFLIAVVQSG